MKSKHHQMLLCSTLFSASIHLTYSLPIPQPGLFDGMFGGFFNFGRQPAATQATVAQQPVTAAASPATSSDTEPADDSAEPADDSGSPLAKISLECRKEAATYTGCVMRCLSGLLGAETAKEGFVSAKTLRVCTFKTCQKKIASDNCLGEIVLLGLGEVRNIAKKTAERIHESTTQVLSIAEKGTGSVENLTKSLSDVTGKLAGT